MSACRKSNKETIEMSFKVAFIGAGSVGFIRRLLSDLLTVPEFHDIDIALRYGVDQCVGDTLAAGGIMYGQRGIPEDR